jgi:RNA polymerase sigma-70 factor (ECF subfamily)
VPAAEDGAGSETRPRRAVDATDVGRIFREEFGRSVATLIRVFGDIDLAEDAVQDAFAVALDHWPRHGLPPNAGGWITMTARNRAIDRLRRRKRERELLGAATLVTGPPEAVPTEGIGPMDDDRLRLIFTCCHPALAPDAQIALTLRLLGGLTTEEVGRAFLVPEATMAKRLTRAKHKIKAARMPYRIPEDHELPHRLPPVLAVVYLIYNAGLDGRGESGLCGEAVRLARLIAALMPGEAEVTGLLALLLLIEARRATRTAPDGSPVVLAEQDRSRWDQAFIAEGLTLVRACLRRDLPGPYQLQAAIQAVHSDAATFEATDWGQIVALYDQLLALVPTPVVALNRAIAVGEVDGPATALELVETLEPALDGYHAFHATRADLLSRLGRSGEAVAAFERAAELAPTEAERDFLNRGGRGAQRPTRSLRRRSPAPGLTPNRARKARPNAASER